MFVDEDRNKYSLKLTIKPNKIKGKIIKLKCVNVNLKGK